MKKLEKNLIFIICIIAFTVLSTSLYFVFNKRDIQVEPDKMLASMYSENFAQGYSFSGTAIFGDGSIYTWNVGDNKTKASMIDYKAGEYESLRSFVLNNAQKQAYTVSNNDLKQMKNSVITLKFMAIA